MGVGGWFRGNIGGLSRTFWVIWSGILINRAGGFAVLFLSLYLTGPRGQSPAMAGLVVGGYGIGSAAGTLLGGVLADRWGRRRTLLLAHLAGAALLAALGLAGNLVLIAVAAVLVGAAQGMPSPAFVAAIIDVTPEADRSRAFNLQFWAFNLGTAAAGLIAGVLARYSFLLLFLSDATTTLITALMIMAWVPESVPHRRPGHTHDDRSPAVRAPQRAGIRTALTDRVFMVFVALTLLMAILSAQSSTILPLTMRDDGLPASAYGLVMSLAGLLIVVGQLFVPGLIRRYRAGRVLAASLAFAALGYGAVAVAGSLGFYLACAVVWTIGAMLAAPPNATVIADLAPPAIRARYQAVFYLTFSLASFIAPAAGGWSWQHLGAVHWLLCGGVGLIAVVGHLLASPPRERRIAAQREVTAEAEQENPREPQIAATTSAAGRRADPDRPAAGARTKKGSPEPNDPGEPSLVPVAHPASPNADGHPSHTTA